MKICLACGGGIDSPVWTCSSCGFAPTEVDGVISFAPELAASNDDYRDESIHLLDSIQAQSFWFRARNRLIADLARRFVPDSRNILEIGCGSGFVLNGLRNAFPGARLTGSELNANGLRYTRKRVAGDVFLYQMDARHLPFRSEFDIVGAFDVIEHIEQDEEVIAQMGQAVIPGGYVILTVPQHPFLWSEFDVYSCHKRRYARNELSEKVLAAGMEIVVNTSFVMFPFPAMLAQRFLQRPNRPYDIKKDLSLPRWLDRTLEILLDGERLLISKGFELPFGGSRMVIARRPFGSA